MKIIGTHSFGSRFRVRTGLFHRNKLKGFTPSFFLENRMLFAISGILFFGILCGALVLPKLSSEQLDTLEGIFGGYLKEKTKEGFLPSFVNTLLSSLLLPLISVLLGMSFVGFPIIPVLPFFEGLGLGIVSTYIYTAYGLKGIAYCALILFPGKAIRATALVFLAKEGIATSYGLFKANRGKGSGTFDSKATLKLYGVKIALLGILTVVSAIVTALTPLIFGRFFE